MPEENELPQMTMSHTKKEMLEAYEAAKKQLQAKERECLDAEKARKQIEKQAASATAEAQEAQEPLKRISDLRSTISRELTSLAERFEQELDAYREVQAAVKAKQEELDTIYGVETAASDLAALIEAQQAKKYEYEQEIRNQRTTFDEEMRAAHLRWDREKAEREQEVRETGEELKKQRQREKEVFEYNFSREKEQRKNALEDELGALEHEIAQKKKDSEQELNQRRAELEAREEAVAKREQEIAALNEEVKAFPETLDKKVGAAVKETTERLTNDFEKSKELLQAKFEGEKNVLSSKIESLQSLVKAQEAQIAELSKRNEQAYEKVQDIANRAVAGAKREYISVPSNPQAAQSQHEKQNT